MLVVTNDPAAQNLSLKVSAQVEILLAINPARIVFPTFIGKDGCSEPLYARLTGSKSTSANIVSFKSANPLLNVEVNKDGFEGDPSRQIRFSILPGVSVGRFREQVIFKTDNADVPTLKLYVMGESIGNIKVTPQNLSLGRITPDSAIKKTVLLKSANNTFRFNIVDVSSTVPGLATELITIKPGKEYQIVVSLPDGAPHPIIRGEIIIKTNTTDQEIITVRVFGHAESAPGSNRRISPLRPRRTKPSQAPDKSKESAPM